MPRWVIIMLRVAAALRPATTRLRRRLSLAAAPTQLDGYWTRQIENLRRPAAQALSDRLASNALGFPHESLDKPPSNGRKTLLLETLEWKL